MIDRINVKQSTKFGQSIIYCFNHLPSIKNSGIFGIYARPCTDNIEAYDNCIKRAEELGKVKDVKGSGGSWSFSLYILVETADCLCLIKETRDNTYIIKEVNL